MRGTLLSAVVLLLVAGLVLWAPLAWAFGNCAAMSMCEGPCGAASCATVGAGPGPGLPFTGELLLQGADEAASALPTRLDLPPRSSLLSA